MQSRIHHAQLISRRLLAQNTFELVLAHKNPELTFRPGQFVSVQVGIDADQNPILRSYSIASPLQRRGEIVIVLRHIEGGVGSQFFAAL